MHRADIGLIGLGVMGGNLALNLERHGYRTAVFNRGTERLDRFLAGPGKGKNISPCRSPEELCAMLDRPRILLMMVKAGAPVDETVRAFLPFLSPGDILVDGGNSDFTDTARRVRELAEKGLLFVGAGISGGAEGARNGPSIMPGGNPDAWPVLKPVLRSIAAEAGDGRPCCDWIGPGGSGHFVKMVHNGIEYADMQMIGEAYWLLKNLAGLSAGGLHDVFSEWNRGELKSYLIGITAGIFAKSDPETGMPAVDVILDAAGQKGTGMWTVRSALELGTAVPTIAEAVFARFLSGLKEERVAASRFPSPVPVHVVREDGKVFADMVRQALYASKICCYAQGFAMMKRASDEFGWSLDPGSIALLWRGGCIIRAAFLEKIGEAFEADPDLPNLLADDFFRIGISTRERAWRRVVSAAVTAGLPVPAFSSALAYCDGYRSAFLPANLIQAQRDYFGAHTYERVDRERGCFFHTDWSSAGPMR